MDIYLCFVEGMFFIWENEAWDITFPLASIYGVVIADYAICSLISRMPRYYKIS